MYARKSFSVRICVCQMIIEKKPGERERERKKKGRWSRKREQENIYINIRMMSPVVANLRQPILPSLRLREKRHHVEIGNLYITNT